MLQAMIFDFNGVILDDEEYHYLSLRRVLDEEGVRISREDYYQECLGFGDVECFQWGFGGEDRLRKAGGMEALLTRKSAYYEELLERETRFCPGVREFVRESASRYSLVVASMALRREIELALGRAGLLECFVGIVSAEEVGKPKPDPEIFQKALVLLNRKSSLPGTRGDRGPIQPAECLVIEDSAPGIQAAKTAGMRVLALTHTLSADRLQGADLIVPSFEAVEPAQLAALFRA